MKATILPKQKDTSYYTILSIPLGQLFVLSAEGLGDVYIKTHNELFDGAVINLTINDGPFSSTPPEEMLDVSSPAYPVKITGLTVQRTT